MKIRNKLLTYIGGSMVVILAISLMLLIKIVTDELNIEQQNQIIKQTETIAKQVEDLTTTSAKSYLKAIGDNSDSVTKGFYRLFIDGKLSLEEARDLAFKNMTDYRFLKTGFIFITDEMGYIIAHPDETKVGTIAPVMAWIQRLEPNEKPFKEYDESLRNKIVYRTYNDEFKFNICVSAFTSEFIRAVDIQELNNSLNNTNVSKTGFPFIINSDGYTLTHPLISERNKYILDQTDISGKEVFREIVEQDQGFFLYSEIDTNGDQTEKIISFKKEKKSELIVIITGDSREFFDIIDVIINFIIIMGVSLVILLMIVIFFVSRRVTKPIDHLTTRLYEISHGDGDLTQRIKKRSNDETGAMVESFNYFLDHLQEMINDVKDSIRMSGEIKDNIIYRVRETSSSIKKISSNIKSIKNQTIQIGAENSENLTNYVIKSMDHITSGSQKISNSMRKVNECSQELESNSEKLRNRINKFKT